MNKCLICGKEISNNIKSCSQKCDSIKRRMESINKWLKGELQGHKDSRNKDIKNFVRFYLQEKNNGKCEKCGFYGVNSYSGKSILQVHHKDGDSNNSCESNLELLCPNCHALTDNYMGINKGKSARTNRYNMEA